MDLHLPQALHSHFICIITRRPKSSACPLDCLISFLHPLIPTTVRDQVTSCGILWKLKLLNHFPLFDTFLQRCRPFNIPFAFSLSLSLGDKVEFSRTCAITCNHIKPIWKYGSLFAFYFPFNLYFELLFHLQWDWYRLHANHFFVVVVKVPIPAPTGSPLSSSIVKKATPPPSPLMALPPPPPNEGTYVLFLMLQVWLEF